MIGERSHEGPFRGGTIRLHDCWHQIRIADLALEDQPEKVLITAEWCPHCKQPYPRVMEERFEAAWK